MNWYKPLLKNKRNTAHKYCAQKVSHAGHSFASKAEAALYDALMLEMKAGIWTEVHTQVSVYLTNARVLYKPDFLCITAQGEKIYHEQKGFETPVWRIKRKLWLYYGDGPLHVWNYDHRRKELIHKETLNPKAKPGVNPP